LIFVIRAFLLLAFLFQIMSMRNLVFTLIAFVLVLEAQAQKKKFTVDAIWAGQFSSAGVRDINWMNDGQHFTSLKSDKEGAYVIRYTIQSGLVKDTLFDSRKTKFNNQSLEIDGYSFSESEDYIILTTGTEPIYRRSSKSEHYLFERKTTTIRQLSKNGKQSYPTCSPDGKMVAFVRSNNLFINTLATGEEKQITTDGKENEIINGSCDWVYEEEFEFAQAFSWNTNSTAIAFYRFDEREVPTYNMQKWGSLYPEDYKYKYPKAGENNSKVSIKIYSLASSKTDELALNMDADSYVARMQWTKDANVVSVRKMNRLQNNLQLIHANISTGKTAVIIQEESPQYIDINDDLRYLDNGKEFLYSSELGGFKQLFVYGLDGKRLRALTPATSDLDEIVGINEKTGLVYFTNTADGSEQRQLYSVSLKGGTPKRITTQTGKHVINMTPTCSYFIDSYSDINTPATTSLYDGSGKAIKVMEDNAKLKATLANYEISRAEFFKFKTEEGTELQGWMIKPTGFDAAKKYPVLMKVYGGPGNQQVMNSWFGADYLWYQMLANEGYMIVCVDGRGTGGRGAAFKKMTYANLGKLELEDQVFTAKYLAKLPYVDGNRIGIWGWSFGGYMSSLCMTKAPDIFKMGIAVAPVTNWRFYDSIYTERYLKTPQLNAAGYDENSPINFAKNLKGAYLLVHGTGDDNVHLQNAIAMQEALIKANKPFEMMTYPNRNHGIYGGMTRAHLYNLMTDFIHRKL